MATSPLFQQVLQTPLFQGLSELESAVLFGIADQQSVRQGATLFGEGDPGDSLYVLLEGTVEVLAGRESHGKSLGHALDQDTGSVQAHSSRDGG